MITFSLLTTALLFGGMTIYAFGFATFIFTELPVETASLLIRGAFPHFYTFVLATATAAAFTAFSSDGIAVLISFFIAISTIFARQILMPMINQATDAGHKQRFKILHGVSVVLTLAHIGAAATVVVRLANG